MRLWMGTTRSLGGDDSTGDELAANRVTGVKPCVIETSEAEELNVRFAHLAGAQTQMV